MRSGLNSVLAVVLMFTLVACGGDNAFDVKPTATQTPVATANQSPTATNTGAPVATNTSAPAATNTRPPTATPTNTLAVPTGTANATVTPTNTLAVPTGTVAATRTPTGTSLHAELEASGVGKYIGMIAPAGNTPGPVWTKYVYDQAGEQAICMLGDQYQVNIHRGTNNKVLFYLEGGGACWDNQTCWVSPLVKTDAAPYFGSGIFVFDDPANPFRDWNIVYASYCDGSVFAGDNVADYEGGRVIHHGLQNISAAATLMREQFPAPDQIVVSGSSAGGYGTYTGYGVTRFAYPETPILVLNDSGPGLQNPDDPAAAQSRADNWRFEDIVPDNCTRCSEQFSYLTEWALERDPGLRYGLFSYLRDVVIRTFNTLEPDAYEALLRSVTGEIESHYPDRFKRFFLQGAGHTVLELPNFFDVEVAGTALTDWTADFLTDGPEWQDLIEAANPFEDFSSQRYSDGSMWMCRPDLLVDQCRVNDIAATAIQPDGSLVVEPREPGDPADEKLDCFYIYPTVDLSPTPGNHTDFSDNSYILDPLLSQAAPFTHSCRVFAPLYRQVTIGTYGSPDAQQYFDIAYGDVSEAFREYMSEFNHGRNLVIMGHSQGTFMTTQLLREFVDPDPELRKRLVVALLIGGSVTVPQGQTVGGTFQNLPLCTTEEQTGCVIAYRSYADGYPPEGGSNVTGPEGTDTACTNPAALGGGKAHFAGTYLPLFANQPIFDVGQEAPPGVETPFVAYHDFYSGECAKDDNNRSYLEVSVDPGQGDVRVNEIPFDHPLFSPGFLGTHVLDYNFAIGDLIRLVDTKAEALRNAQ